MYVDAARGQDGIATVAVMSLDGEKTISAASVKKIRVGSSRGQGSHSSGHRLEPEGDRAC